jgi:hypothetical protein
VGQNIKEAFPEMVTVVLKNASKPLVIQLPRDGNPRSAAILLRVAHPIAALVALDIIRDGSGRAADATMRY